MGWGSPIPPGTRRRLRLVVKVMAGALALLGIMTTGAGLAFMGFQIFVATRAEQGQLDGTAKRLERIYRPGAEAEEAPPPAPPSFPAPPALPEVLELLRTGKVDRESHRALNQLTWARFDYLETLTAHRAAGRTTAPAGSVPAAPGTTAPPAAGDGTPPGSANSIKEELLDRERTRLREKQAVAEKRQLERALELLAENDGRLPADRIVEWAGRPEVPETIWFPGDVQDESALIHYARLRGPSLGFRNLAASSWLLLAFLAWIVALVVLLRRAEEMLPYLWLAARFVLAGFVLGLLYLVGGVLEGSTPPLAIFAQGVELLLLNPPTHLVFGAVGLWLLARVRRRHAPAGRGDGPAGQGDEFPGEGDAPADDGTPPAPDTCRAAVAGPNWLRDGLLGGLVATLWTSLLFLTVEWHHGATLAAQSALRQAFGLPEPGHLVMYAFVFAAATWEELQYRAFLVGVILSLVPGWLGRALAYLLPATLWTCLHVGMIEPEWLKALQLFPVGILLTGLLLRQGLAAAVVAHVVLNFFAITLPFFR